MAKLNKEDFKNKYSEKFKDNDELLIELLEDVEDSFNVIETYSKKFIDFIENNTVESDDNCDDSFRSDVNSYTDDNNTNNNEEFTTSDSEEENDCEESEIDEEEKILTQKIFL